MEGDQEQEQEREEERKAPALTALRQLQGQERCPVRAGGNPCRLVRALDEHRRAGAE